MWAECFRAKPTHLTENRTASSSKEIPMSWSVAIRQSHRLLAILFTVTVIANFVSMALGKPPAWIVYSPLAPLFLLMFTGLYMFVLPYMGKRRGSARSG